MTRLEAVNLAKQFASEGQFPAYELFAARFRPKDEPFTDGRDYWVVMFPYTDPEYVSKSLKLIVDDATGEVSLMPGP